jgi:hypothetical protein
MSFTAKHAVIIHLTHDNASVLHCYTQCLSTYLSLVGTVQALVQHATTLPGGPLLNVAGTGGGKPLGKASHMYIHFHFSPNF